MNIVVFIDTLIYIALMWLILAGGLLYLRHTWWPVRALGALMASVCIAAMAGMVAP